LNQTEFWWIVPLSSFLASLLGAGTAFAGLVWRYRADYKREIVGQLLGDIQIAADLSTDYWILDPTADASNPSKIRNSQARIKGFAERLEASIDAARPHLRKIDTLGMDIPWSKFIDALRGGDFDDPLRAPDPERAENAQFHAAELIQTLRSAADRRFLRFL
jgi:hypothetical protein